MLVDEARATRSLAVSSSAVCAWFIGDARRGEFSDAIDLLRRDTQLSVNASVRDAIAGTTSGCPAPELVVIAQSRPGTLNFKELQALGRRFPLAGMVSLLGAWCEGEGRTGRPLPGATRLYWHEFPQWWTRQIERRNQGRCTDWLRPRSSFDGARALTISPPPSSFDAPRGLVVISTPRWETADAIGDLLQVAGYASIWPPRGRGAARIRGAVAGVWEGGMLDEGEAQDLTEFCERLSPGGARVVALLDAPQVDRARHARRLGAAWVLGKPWINAELVAAVEACAWRMSPGGISNAFSVA